MARRERLLDRATSDAVRRVAAGRIVEATVALERLKDRRDREALHDFRVAVRRLRSLLRAYRRWLGRTAATKVRRRLRDLGSATNAGRDAEVQLAWLEAQRSALARGERTGLNWLMRNLRATRRESYTGARRHMREDFARVSDMIEKRLAELDETGPPFRETFALLLRQHSAELEARLTAIRGPEDEENAHEARISAKRLRYLLEPVRTDAAGVRPLVAHLKDLQDLLGSLHDMHVLETGLLVALEAIATSKAHHLRSLALAGDPAAVHREHRRDERLGLVALAARARTERDRLFASLTRRWLHDGGRDFFREAAEVAETVGREPGVPVERERKFLLRRLPDAVRAAEVQEIDQGWLPGERLRERLRRTRDGDGEHFYRTVKLGTGLERIELEEETTAHLFAALWEHTEGCRVTKRRYRIPDGAAIWEIDEFRDRELVLAEIELPRADTEVRIPDWLEPLVVREVTGEPAYLNLTLASNPGLPKPRRARRPGGRARRGAMARSP
ncbi:MAG: CHAD domain-containing protein [Gemmatimonadota bacterium]|nr:CHAD domain-containing protein [Gemmatimonadota bacterium]